jgi:nucleoside-diphosphate-sugar epimerase
VKIGSVEAVRDFTYVKDAVSGFLAVAYSDAAVGTTMNIGTGEGISIDRLVESVSKVMGKKLSVQAEQERMRPEKSEVWELIADYSKARDIIDWAPSYSMEEGLEETVAWIQANLNRYKVDLYNI